jgi:hypothetical protein
VAEVSGWVPPSVLVAPRRELWEYAFACLEEPKRQGEPAFLGDLLVRALPTSPERPPEESGLTRNAFTFVISTEEYEALYAPRKAGPETREEWAARVAAEEAREAATVEAWRLLDAAVAEFAASGQRAIREVAALHKPVGDAWPHCEGCDGAGESYAEWPCATVGVLAGVMGSALPDHHNLEREP